jgi:hypothetical protein
MATVAVAMREEERRGEERNRTEERNEEEKGEK